MRLEGLLIANRGEVAIRVARAAAELGIRSVAVYSEDDEGSLHLRAADEAVALRGTGPAAYLDAEQLLGAARATGCRALHPGYGFLSERADFARRCADAGLTFVGPRPEVLDLFGDKAAARALAGRCGVPVLRGTDRATTLAEARSFLEALGDGGSMLVKAVAGGGGRGMRAVHDPDTLEEAYERCRSEARAAFGHDEVYVEELLPHARHVEIQVLGDDTGAVSHLGERECSLQRRRQKLVEVAPSPSLPAGLRTRLEVAALALAEAVRLDNLATVEFLVDATPDGPGHLAFIEANPRLQVEHTVTEEVTGVDLVRSQLELAAGRSLADLALTLGEVPAPRGFAVQVRVNAETVAADGATRPSGGTVTAFDLPSGPGVRVDTGGHVGYRPNPRFDPLLAKVVVRSSAPSYAEAAAKAYRALCELRVEGVRTNAGFLLELLRHPDVIANRVTTRFVEEQAVSLAAGGIDHPRRFFEPTTSSAPSGAADTRTAAIDSTDPLAVLVHGKVPPATPVEAPPAAADLGPGIGAPMAGTVVSVDVDEGDAVRPGQQILVMEAMKMEHVVAAEVGGIVRHLLVAAGDTVAEGHPLAVIEPADVAAPDVAPGEELDLDEERADLAEVLDRHARTLDAARPDAVARRRRTGQRTARENVDDLCDPGSFVEYGALVIAAQRRRRTLDDLVERTPADGLVGGVGRVNGRLFDDDRARCVVMSYDYTVLAGTQGQQNHRKKDRLFELAERSRLPVVLLTEGGGGRPGDTDGLGVAGLDCMAFALFGRLSGLVPLVGIASGRCFAGNAALLGCCDVVIATEGATIGMGGPAMIEGGGLGIYRPEEVGPLAVQVPNGVVDVAVADEAEAVRVAKQYLSYFQGPVATWSCADQRLLRSAIPENRLRVYDVRRVIELLADTGSVLELRRHFGPGMVTALIRIEGRPMGVVANNPVHLAGAIDSDGADKAARFLQLCDAFDLPVVFLCDTPGIMVGPEAEKTALVRHASRLFVTGASLTVPFCTVVLRKGYGLGAQAMAGGSFKAPVLTVAWPTGEFGGMGLEGAVKLGYRNELAAIDDPAERRALFDQMVARMYEHGKAVNTASHFEIDDVIDPADSRRVVLEVVGAGPGPPARRGKKRPCVDTW
ncbi:MAG: carbamoyl-phosphate synthase large subunit [Acidimicrobiales bacterium]|nr:carbamoyl-phosphate synthase large subunit [Acidimicrobiales bacterium]